MSTEHGDVQTLRSVPVQPDRPLVVDAIPAQVWRAGSDGAIAFVNQQWIDYTGLSLEEGVMADITGWVDAHLPVAP